MDIEDMPLEAEDDEWMDRYTLAGRLASLRYRLRRSTRKGQAMGCGAIVGFCGGAGFIFWVVQMVNGG
jgi:hypothetical protein